MNISLQTGIVLNRYGFDEGFRIIKEAGFDSVEVNLDNCIPAPRMKAGDVEWYCKVPNKEIRKAYEPMKEAAAKYGVTFYQAHAPFPTRLKDEKTNSLMQTILEKTAMTCQYLECPNMVVHEGFLDYGEDTSDEWEYNMNLYMGLVPALKKYGVTCCLENLFRWHDGHGEPAPCWCPDDAVRYVDALNERAGEKLFGFCLDIGHVILMKQDVYEFVHKLGDRLICTHIHDNNGLADQHIFPYMGIGDWDRFCLAMKEIGFNRTISFETFNALRMFDSELTPEMVNLVGGIAKLFRRRILGELPIGE